MISPAEFIKHSLETQLFFNRIMKEHLEVGATALMPRDRGMIPQLQVFIKSYDNLLKEAIPMARGVVSQDFIESQEMVTPYTLPAEKVTEFLTGLPIDTTVTQAEMELVGNCGCTLKVPCGLEEQVDALNDKAICLTQNLANTLEKMYQDVMCCKMFTFIYPDMLHHIIEETHYYLETLKRLQERKDIDSIRHSMLQETFWNHIMEEHSEFIRGLLDPNEKESIRKTEKFADKFEKLYEAAKKAIRDLDDASGVTRESLRSVKELKEFKTEGVEGILDCKLKALILPLLADHVLREANHYLRLLKHYEEEH